MSKNFFYTSLIITVMLFSATIVLAQDFGLTETASRLGYNTSEKEPIYAKVQTVVGVTLSLLAIVFFIVMMYAGLRWMTARGNDELAAKAKNALEAGTIGLIICVSSYAISSFVLSRLGSEVPATEQVTGSVGSVCQTDTDCKDNNVVCDNGRCITICLRKYGNQARCVTEDQCVGEAIKENLCNAGTTCCHFKLNP